MNPTASGPAAALVVPVGLALAAMAATERVGWSQALVLVWVGWIHLGLVILAGDPRIARDGMGFRSRSELLRRLAGIPGTAARWLVLCLAAAVPSLGLVAVVLPGTGGDIALFVPGAMLSALCLLAPVRAARSWGIPGGRTLVVLLYPLACMVEITMGALRDERPGLLLQPFLPPFSAAAELSERIRFGETLWFAERADHIAIFLGFWFTTAAAGAALRSVRARDDAENAKRRSIARCSGDRL